MKRCGMSRPSGSHRCGQIATWRLSAMCVHEHDLDGCYLCAACAQYASGDRWTCVPCARSADPHDCPVTPRLSLISDGLVT